MLRAHVVDTKSGPLFEIEKPDHNEDGPPFTLVTGSHLVSPPPIQAFCETLDQLHLGSFISEPFNLYKAPLWR